MLAVQIALFAFVTVFLLSVVGILGMSSFYSGFFMNLRFRENEPEAWPDPAALEPKVHSEHLMSLLDEGFEIESFYDVIPNMPAAQNKPEQADEKAEGSGMKAAILRVPGENTFWFMTIVGGVLLEPYFLTELESKGKRIYLHTLSPGSIVDFPAAKHGDYFLQVMKNKEKALEMWKAHRSGIEALRSRLLAEPVKSDEGFVPVHQRYREAHRANTQANSLWQVRMLWWLLKGFFVRRPRLVEGAVSER